MKAGSRLGPYEVLSPLGAGGMGEVYRAKDTRLKREVALKILPKDVEFDPERQKRFLREAQAASALNHPNILVVYDVGSENSSQYIVSELIEGEPLRRLLHSGPIPNKQLLALAIQIADGLAAAHQAGIVHRDLKPENIMVTGENRVKILDFGLAKLSSLGSEQAETISRSLTQTGALHGTPIYMSPEQAAGKSIDFRSDQFSFGSILYEMATGKKPFRRESLAETLSAIIREEPTPIASLNPKIPAPLCWLIERCMAKDPRQRYDATTDLYRDLRDLPDRLSQVTEANVVVPVAVSRSRWRLFGIASGILIAALLGLSFFAGNKTGFKSGVKSAEKPVPTFQLLTFQRGNITSARFTADGNTIVYSGAFNENPLQVYMRRPEIPESHLVSVPSADVLSVSSKGQLALGIRANDRSPYSLILAPLAGGATKQALENVEFADWTDSNNLAVVRIVAGKRRVEFPVGKVVYESNGEIRNLRVSPNGNFIAFCDRPETLGEMFITIIDSAGKKTTFPGGGYHGLAWSSDGKEVWFNSIEEGTDDLPGQMSTLIRAVTTTGETRSITRFTGDFEMIDISRSGELLLNRGSLRIETRGLAPGDTEERDFSYLDGSFPWGLSSDGKTLLINEWGVAGGNDGLMYVRRTDTSTPIALGKWFGCAISPDGYTVLSLQYDAEGGKMVLLPVGPGEPKTLKRGEIRDFKWWASFFPDGKRIVINGSKAGHAPRCYIQTLPDGEPHAFTPEGVTLPQAGNSVSPDGRTVIATGPDRNFHFYPIDGSEIRPVPGLTPNDRFCRWHQDGRSVFVSNQELPGKIFRVDVFSGKRTLWKEIMPPERAGLISITPIQLSPDGKSYFYRPMLKVSELFLVKGLK